MKVLDLDMDYFMNKKVSSTLQLPCPSFLRGGFLFLSFSFIIES